MTSNSELAWCPCRFESSSCDQRKFDCADRHHLLYDTGVVASFLTRIPQWIKVSFVLICFAIGFSILSIRSYSDKSPPQDELPDLTWGYKTLKYGRFSLDMNMPPFLQEWCAIPLVLMKNVKMSQPDDPSNYHRFFYEDNDISSQMIWVRLCAIVWGVVLGILVFFWALEAFDFWTAVGTLILCLFEPTILGCAANARADVGTACFIFGTIYFLWRCTRRLTFGNIAGLLIFCSLGAISKFSAALLGPLVACFLAVRVCQRTPWPFHFVREGAFTSRVARLALSLIILILLGLSTWLAIWAVYGFRFSVAEATPAQLTEYLRLLQEARGVWSPIPWVRLHHLFPDAMLNAILLQRQHMDGCLCYFWGKYSMTGWWYHLPVVFLFRTSCALIIAFVGGVVSSISRPKKLLGPEIYFLLPVLALFAAGMASPYQPELRDIWPIYPFVLLLAAKGLSELLTRGQRWIVGGILVVSVVESVTAYPDYLAFANWFIGGPNNAWKFIQPSNSDQGQDLKLVKKWMDEKHVDHIYLGCRGSDDPAYYKIHCTHLPPGLPYPTANLIRFESFRVASGATEQWKFVANSEGPLQLPGYVAVSVDRLLIGPVLYGPLGAAIYGPFRQQKPVAFLGHTIFVYWVEKPWW